MTATYFAFRDDVLTGLLARQAHMQYAYEDRIADLRSQVDRLAGAGNCSNQEQVESKLDQMARRQATLKSRSSTLTGDLPRKRDRLDQASRLGAATRARATTQGTPKPSPISDTVISWRRPIARRGSSRACRPSTARRQSMRQEPGRRNGLARLTGALDRSSAPGRGAQRRRGGQGSRSAGCAGSSPISA